MSKPLDGNDQYADELAVSRDILSAPPPSGQSERNSRGDVEAGDADSLHATDPEMEPLFRLRLNMARGRAAKINILRGQLAGLDAAYAAARAPLDRQVLNEADREITIYLAGDIVRRHNPPALECGSQAEAKILLREVLLKYLLSEQDRIISDFRVFCVNSGRGKVGWPELTDYILRRHWDTLLDALEPLEKNLPPPIRKELMSELSPERLRNWCFSYPPAVTPKLDIYDRPQLEAFYGHLIAAVSGLQRQRYEQFVRQCNPLRRELEILDSPGAHLPSTTELGPLAGQLRIHLLRQLFRQRLGREVPSAFNYDPQELLEHYDYFDKKKDSQNLLQQFESLPQHGFVGEGMARLVGKETRQSIIAALEKGIGSPWLMENLAELLALIHGLDGLGPKGVPEGPTLASQFGQELRILLTRAAEIKKPADPSIIESLFEEMTDQVQLARYCFENLSRSANS